MNVVLTRSQIWKYSALPAEMLVYVDSESFEVKCANASHL